MENETSVVRAVWLMISLSRNEVIDFCCKHECLTIVGSLGDFFIVSRGFSSSF